MPKTTAVGNFANMTWVTDAQYAVIPKGVSADTLTADLDLIAWMLKPDQQAISYDKGYFYPGPAVKDVTLDMAPADSQAALKDVVPAAVRPVDRSVPQGDVAAGRPAGDRVRPLGQEHRQEVADRPPIDNSTWSAEETEPCATNASPNCVSIASAATSVSKRR